jgi:NAD(P)-dependent dehydrogenase (short-subunit alcohol dehydrogenase family)
MTSDVARRVAIVTGGAGGIGTALVGVLCDHGYEVASLDIAQGSVPGAAINLLADVSSAPSVDEAVATVLDRYGRVDVVINNAAILSTQSIEQIDEAEWDRVMAVNVKSAFLMSRATIPALRSGGGGSIVNVSSVHGVAAMPTSAAYAASKGALIALSRQMAVDYADDKIRVNSVVVGRVRTPMSEAHTAAMNRDPQSVPRLFGELGRAAAPVEVARAIAFLVSSEASFITGSSFVLDGGLLARLM